MLDKQRPVYRNITFYANALDKELIAALCKFYSIRPSALIRKLISDHAIDLKYNVITKKFEEKTPSPRKE